MAAKVLTIKNLQSSPFPAFVEAEIRKGLQPLTMTGVVEVDFTGGKRGDYTLPFETTATWREGKDRDRCWHRPGTLGETQEVSLDRIQKWNFCLDVTVCSTCEPVFRHSESELGRAIASTAVHEIGHLFGLSDRSSFAGADGAGHVGDERNYMLDARLHKDWAPLRQDAQRSTKYVIRQGDTLSKIADRIGFLRLENGSWTNLWEYQGKDGRKNREILRSKDPTIVSPGEEIWVPDVRARAAFLRSLELTPKTFTKSQIDGMARWIREGRELMEVEYR